MNVINLFISLQRYCFFPQGWPFFPVPCGKMPAGYPYFAPTLRANTRRVPPKTPYPAGTSRTYRRFARNKHKSTPPCSFPTKQHIKISTDLPPLFFSERINRQKSTNPPSPFFSKMTAGIHPQVVPFSPVTCGHFPQVVPFSPVTCGHPPARCAVFTRNLQAFPARCADFPRNLRASARTLCRFHP